MNAAERVNDLRADATNQGINVEGLSDVEVVLAAYDRARTEAYDAGHKVQAILVDQAKRERVVLATTRRNAQDDRRTLAGHYLQALIEGADRPITGLIYRIEQLPERGGVKPVAALKEAARDAKYEISVAQRHRATHPEMVTIGMQRAEIARLRDYISSAAAAIHTLLSTRVSGCDCPGCELLIGMDDVPAEVTDVS